MKGIFKIIILLVCLILGTNLYNLHIQSENERSEEEHTIIIENKLEPQKIYYENGELKEIWHYEDDTENGTFLKYYRNGNLYSKGQVLNGEYNGLIIYYYENGSLESEWEFENGFAHGKYIAYHKNGNIKIEATRQNGTYHGVMTHYSEEGMLETRSFYEFGQVRKQTNFDLVSVK